jgi:ABC-type branched-subunit amino acid transport system ATPase component
VVTFGVRRPAGALVAGMTSYAFPRILGAGFHWPSFVPSFVSWDGTSSVLIPSMLFGLGAIALAKHPDGVIAKVSETMHRGRRRRSAPTEAMRSEAVPAQEAALPLAAEGGLASHALVLDGVRVGYGGAEVLHGIDLVLSEGRVLALLGANGGGKSTLCAAISGQVHTAAGAVRLARRDLTGLPAHRRAEAGVVLVPEASGVFPGLSVEENLQLWLPEPAQRAAAYERFPQLAARRSVPAGSLSGGEQQMLTVAPVVVRTPRVLIADEPTLGLAPRVVEELMRIFRELADAGASVLLVEERATAALAISDDVAFLELGRIVWRGPRSDVDADQLAAVYLGESPEDLSVGTDEGSR